MFHNQLKQELINYVCYSNFNLGHKPWSGYCSLFSIPTTHRTLTQTLFTHSSTLWMSRLLLWQSLLIQFIHTYGSIHVKIYTYIHMYIYNTTLYLSWAGHCLTMHAFTDEHGYGSVFITRLFYLHNNWNSVFFEFKVKHEGISRTSFLPCSFFFHLHLYLLLRRCLLLLPVLLPCICIILPLWVMAYKARIFPIT